MSVVGFLMFCAAAIYLIALILVTACELVDMASDASWHKEYYRNRKMKRADFVFPSYPIAKWLNKEIE